MSRLAFGGFEVGYHTSAVGWQMEAQVYAGGIDAGAPTTSRSGTYSQELTGSPGGGTYIYRIGYRGYTIPTGRWFYVRLYWKTSGLPGSTAPFFNIEARTDQTGPGIASSSTNHFTLADGPPGGTVTTLATFAMTITANRWYCLEVGLNISSGTSTDDQVTARITDDVTGATETVTTVMNANHTSIPASFRVTNADSTKTFTIDDWAMNDSTVPTGYLAGQPYAQDGFPGPGKVFYLPPVSAVTTTGWTQSSGFSGVSFVTMLGPPATGGGYVTTTGTNPLDMALADPSGLSLPYAVSCAMPVAIIGGQQASTPGVGLSASPLVPERIITAGEFTTVGVGHSGTKSGAAVPGTVVYQPSLPSTPVVRVRPTTATVTGTIGGADVQQLGMYLDAQPITGGRRLSMLV